MSTTTRETEGTDFLRNALAGAFKDADSVLQYTCMAKAVSSALEMTQEVQHLDDIIERQRRIVNDIEELQIILDHEASGGEKATWL